MYTAVIIDYIVKSYVNKVKSKNEKCKFFSVFADGSIELSIYEKKALFVIYFDCCISSNKIVGISI